MLLLILKGHPGIVKAPSGEDLSTAVTNYSASGREKIPLSDGGETAFPSDLSQHVS